MNARTAPLVRTAPVVLLASIACWLSGTAAELRLGQVIVPPGAIVSVPVALGGASGAVGAQFDVSFDPSAVSLSSISAGDSLAGHVADQRQLAPGLWRALVYSTTNGPIAPGTVVWLSFSVATSAPDGVVPLVMSNAIVARVAGQRVQPLAQVNGALIISSVEHFVSLTLTGGQVVATVTGLRQRVFTLQGSPDLFHWADLATYTNQSGTLLLTNTPPKGYKDYFYRTVFRPSTPPPGIPAPSLSGVALLLAGNVRFQLNATAGSAWRVEGSPDLVYWGNYGVVTNLSGTLAITNTPYMKPGVYFYRAAAP